MSNVETLDDLIIDGLRIYQRIDQFRFSFDAIALLHFCKFNGHHRYVDLGTGTGVLPLVGTSLGAGHITGIEINSIVANLAKRSVIYNNKSHVVHIEEGDYRYMQYQLFGDKPFDGVLVNPPYFDHAGGNVPSESSRHIALHDEHTSLEDVIASAKRLIKYKGRLWMVYSAPRLAEAFSILRTYQFTVKRLRMVHGRIDKPAKIVLIEAIQGGQEGLIVEEPLIVYHRPNEYTEEVSRWYEG
ncbi:tRNA1(Val) (adenine(37)-N6)-methyltransferase [Veillonella agrestimuris]|uniref:tRNA1(Val) (adenine(37)-N6)-methyltransferase n=1 Tax=Veillonella agrestimuris TaxID=2941340 RepID=UPI00204129D6|nr:methyltransferase [Veillonella agrestimuris]